MAAAKTEFTMSWYDLLERSVKDPGIISEAYSRFHNFSFGNQLAAFCQLENRGIAIAPIKTFKQWQALGRQVQKGQKAIWLNQPLSFKDKKDETKVVTCFKWKPSWFALSQTDGEDFELLPTLPQWDKDLALSTLKIELKEFEMLNGNIQGWARPNDNQIALNPIAFRPYKTLFHEIAHVLMHKTKEDNGDTFIDDENINNSIRELEAEAVAMLLCATLDLDGLTESRAYIQSYFKEDKVPEKSAERILSIASKILKAGQTKPEEKE